MADDYDPENYELETVELHTVETMVDCSGIRLSLHVEESVSEIESFEIAAESIVDCSGLQMSLHVEPKVSDLASSLLETVDADPERFQYFVADESDLASSGTGFVAVDSSGHLLLKLNAGAKQELAVGTTEVEEHWPPA